MGKIIIYSQTLSDFDKSIGVEFNKERYKKAKTAQKRIFPTRKTQRLVFDKGTLFNKKYFNNKKNSVYFISNLCFTEAMNKKLTHYFNKYRTNKKFKTLILCSKELPGLNYKYVENINAKMTWSSTSNLYKYEL